MVQWLKLRLPMQGYQLDPWSGSEDSTCFRAKKQNLKRSNIIANSMKASKMSHIKKSSNTKKRSVLECDPGSLLWLHWTHELSLGRRGGEHYEPYSSCGTMLVLSVLPTSTACLRLCFCWPPHPRAPRLLSHCSDYPGEEKDFLWMGMGWGRDAKYPRC